MQKAINVTGEYLSKELLKNSLNALVESLLLASETLVYTDLQLISGTFSTTIQTLSQKLLPLSAPVSPMMKCEILAVALAETYNNLCSQEPFKECSPTLEHKERIVALLELYRKTESIIKNGTKK